MPTRSYDCKIMHGKEVCVLNFVNSKYVYRDLMDTFKDGDKVTVEVKSRRKPRSLSQNSVLHWYLQEIVDETGMSLNEIKEAMRHLFLSVDMVNKEGEIVSDKRTGEVIKVYRSTADLSTVEFNEFTENIRLWANDFLGLQLPLPNEEVELRFK